MRRGRLADEFKRAQKLGVTNISLNKLVIRAIKTDCVPFMTNLTCLDLSSNTLRSVPKGFGTLNQLKRLALNDNKFDSIPSEIFKLKL